LVEVGSFIKSSRVGRDEAADLGVVVAVTKVGEVVDFSFGLVAPGVVDGLRGGCFFAKGGVVVGLEGVSSGGMEKGDDAALEVAYGGVDEAFLDDGDGSANF